MNERDDCDCDCEKLHFCLFVVVLLEDGRVDAGNGKLFHIYSPSEANSWRKRGAVELLPNSLRSRKMFEKDATLMF